MSAIAQKLDRFDARRRTDGLASATAEFDQLEELCSKGVPPEHMEPLMRLVIMLQEGGEARSHASVPPVDVDPDGEAYAIRLLNALLPVGFVPVDASNVALAALPRLGNFRPRLLKWLVLAHETLDCWDVLKETQKLFFFLLRDPGTVADASFALLRLCRHHVRCLFSRVRPGPFCVGRRLVALTCRTPPIATVAVPYQHSPPLAPCPGLHSGIAAMALRVRLPPRLKATAGTTRAVGAAPASVEVSPPGTPPPPFPHTPR
eukprot:7260887-Prymnesium_polylepis.1